MAKILYTHSYIRRARKFAKRHPELLSQYEKTLKLLESNPSHPSLGLQWLGVAFPALAEYNPSWAPPGSTEDIRYVQSDRGLFRDPRQTGSGVSRPPRRLVIKRVKQGNAESLEILCVPRCQDERVFPGASTDERIGLRNDPALPLEARAL